MVNVYSYLSVRNFVIADTDENGENWYMTNNSQFTVFGIKVSKLPWVNGKVYMPKCFKIDNKGNFFFNR